jgi:hypothetical protein
MGDTQRVLLQLGTALAVVYLGWWIYRHPRKSLFYGDLANQPAAQKFITVLGTLAMFSGAYAVALIAAGPYLPDAFVGLFAAAFGIAVTWCARRIPVRSE